jgi:hypothetical protein
MMDDFDVTNARVKRNIAHILMVISLTPILTWMLLTGMALSGSLFPWIAAGIFVSGGYFLFLSLCMTSLVLIWSNFLKARQPNIWTSKHRIPVVAAKLVLALGVICNIGLWAWNSLHHPPELSNAVTLPAEENHQIQEQMNKKIQELENRSRGQ